MHYLLLATATLLGLGTLAAGPPAPSLQLRLEVWEVPTLAWVRELDLLGDTQSLDAWRLQQFTAKDRRLLHAPALVLSDDSTATAESIEEQIYPVEYFSEGLDAVALAQNPPPIPTPPNSLSTALQKRVGALAYTAFETRNTGLTLQANATVVGGEETHYDVSISFEEVKLLSFERFTANLLSFPQPHFTSFRTSRILRTTIGHWHLLSAQAPPPTLHQEPSPHTWITILRLDPLP